MTFQACFNLQNAPHTMIRLLRTLSSIMLGAFLLINTALGAAKPNIVLIVSDDAGYADFGFMSQLTGQPTEFKTPRLDQLAQEGVLFSNAYVSGPACSPSRAGMLTGRYQQRFGVDYNYGEGSNPLNGTPGSEVMISEALKQQGYATGLIGKWHQGIDVSQRPLSQGFDRFYGMFEGGRPYFNSATGGLVREGSTAVQWHLQPSFNNVAPDPVLGRFLTDAFGDESSRFIAENANQANPFFLYTAFNGPHSPYTQAKQSDLDQFASTSLTGLRKNVAALTYGDDRNIGTILDRLEDPNGDGNTSDSVADNTIVIFVNDNGAPPPEDPQAMGQVVHSNGPLLGHKSGAFEGGVRIPMIIRAPGVDPAIVNEMVSTLDFFPTLVKAAGGVPSANLDGVDLMPLLSGDQVGPVHDKLVFRMGNNGWSIRKGDWKLARGTNNKLVELYHLNPDGSGETVPLNASNPAKVWELTVDYVDWEAQMGKGSQTTIRVLNQFDEFRFRSNLAATANWRDSGAWLNNQTPGANVTMTQEDSYANAVVAFTPRDDVSFTSTNNISRMSGLSYSVLAGGAVAPAGFSEFMLNELRFDGQFAGASNLNGTINGYPLMFVKKLDGTGAKISLNSTAVGAPKFTFNVNTDVVLHANLEITGNSTQGLNIGGQIRDFNGARSLTKTGTSTVVLSGNNTYAGSTIVNGGVLRIEGASAALANTQSVQIGAQGKVSLISGSIRTPVVQVSAGGAFDFDGGVLETAQFQGNLSNFGGTVKPGLGVGALDVTGSFMQTGTSKLSIEIGGLSAGSQYDQLRAANVALGGVLEVTLANLGGGLFAPGVGNIFEVVKSNGTLTGSFSSVLVPTLSAGKKWAIGYQSKSVLLQVVTNLGADFDHNGIVNGADLSVWKTAMGATAAGDADLDGDTDGNDFLVWQRQLGFQLVAAAANQNVAGVPEPNSFLLAASAALVLIKRRRSAKKVA
jgi:autotransporter-associated beta strand protein